MIGSILFKLKSVRFLIAWFVCYKSMVRDVVHYETDRWAAVNGISKDRKANFLTLMMKFPEFRSLIYHRTGANWLRHFGKGQTNLYFHTPSERIGKGLIIWHGYSTVINADSIGEDCQIWHNVTIGKKTTDPVNDRPRIGNGVRICTGSIVVGEINIADGVTVGAGSTVVDSVEKENAVVVGCKARVL